MRNQQPSHAMHPSFYLGGDEDHDVETNENDNREDPCDSSDDSSSLPDSPVQSFGRASTRSSHAQTPQWPQSYRQSMDIYSNLTSPSLSFLSPNIARFSSSYLSSSLKRRSVSPEIATSLTKPFVPTKEEKGETTIYEPPSSVVRKHSAAKVVDYHEIDRGCSATQAVLNGMNVLCGVGVLSTPFAVKEGGWVGLGLLFVIAIVSCYTGLLLRHCLDSQEGLETYPDIGQAAFGTIGRLFISIILYTELYACCVEFLILEGDNLSAMFPHAHVKYYGVSLEAHELFTIMTALFVLPTVWLRNLSLLSYVSAGGVMASILVVICVFCVGTVDGVGFTQSGPLLNLATLPVAIGLYGFCYSGHAVFPNIYTSLKNRNQFTTVLVASFVICTLMYGGVAVMGFLMFGEKTQSQITLNMPKQYVASNIALWTTVVNPFTKYALTITPVALSLEELLPSDMYSLKNYWSSIVIRTIIVISTLCVALLIPFFAFVMSFIGSLLSMLVCLILPPACFLKIVGNKATLFQKIFCIIIMVIGVACSITGTFSSLIGIIKSL